MKESIIMYTETDVGDCCGRVTHADTGYFQDTPEHKRQFDRRIESYYGKIQEINLTDQQCKRRPHILKWMKAKSFKLCYRGVNSGSGNVVNVFLRIENARKRTLKDRPFKY